MRTDDALDKTAGSPLILVAEDNEDNRYIAATILRHSGYRVIEAETGTDAIRMARAQHPSLILMDVGMPDTDGLTATRTLKADVDTRDIVILAFTAHALPGAAEQSYDAGCDGHLVKPIAPTQLVRDVAAAIARGAAA